MNVDDGIEKAVSVIVPIYNTQEYLSDCLDSIIFQSLKNIEILCINDGSTDQSLEIMQEYAKKDNRIVVINQKNCGLSATRNRGIELAKGKYIFFLDSDDKICNHALQLLYESAEENDSEAVFFNADAFYESEELERNFPYFKHEYERLNDISGVTDGKEILEWYGANTKFVAPACLVFVRKSFIIDNELSFYDGILYEDNLFQVQLLLALKKGFVIHDKLYLSRVRENSIVTTTQSSFHRLYSFFICYFELLFLNSPKTSYVCIQMLLSQFYDNLFNEYKNMNGQKLTREDLLVYKKMTAFQRNFLAHLGVVLKKDLRVLPLRLENAKRVVIYGAGALGRKIYEQLNNVNDIQVVGVVDRNYAMLGQVDGYTVESPDVIGKINFDIIIIAVLDEITAEGIKKRLEKEYGISAQYMAWYGNYVDYSIGG